jgi:hypothetical protein
MQQFLGSLMGNLQRKGYTQLAVGSPFVLAMLKQAEGLSGPKLVGVIANTDAPGDSYNRVHDWALKAIGRSGAGVLLLATNRPPQSYINEALGQGSGALGYGQLVCGVYDVGSNTYYLPKGVMGNYHLGWDHELFG